MRRRPKYKKTITPPPAKHIFVVTFLFFIISTFASIWIINEGIEPTLMDIAETKTKQFTRDAINQAVSKKIADDLEYEQLIQAQYDDSGELISVGWNGSVTNRVVRNATNRVQNFLRQLERGEVPQPGLTSDVELEPEENPSIEEVRKDPLLVEIPMGQALGIPILSNLGPNIPVNLELISHVQSEPVMRRSEHGINFVYLELVVHLEVDVRVVVPFTSRPTTVTNDIMIDNRLFKGDVPQYYSGGNGGENPDFSIPLDDLPGPE